MDGGAKPTIDMADDSDPIAKQIKNELKKLDGRAVAWRHTVHGRALVLQVDGKAVDVPFEADTLEPLPAKFKPQHRDVMEIIFSAVTQIAENPNRIVPLTRKEAVGFGADKGALKDLERWGLIESFSIKCVPKTDPRATKGTQITIVYFTPQGRAYVRDQFDADYGKPASEAVGGTGDGVAAVDGCQVQ